MPPDGQHDPKTHGPAKADLIKAAGYLLVGFGAPVALAFLYPFYRRRGSSMWDHMEQTDDHLTVLLVGGAVGVVMLVAGFVLINLAPGSTRR
ncbi:MAG TPA: hypothetical protein VD929_06190 [Caulobacteraceae bacterium]|nr:hypothetical protein [Caulobacteraceae bacterium]